MKIAISDIGVMKMFACTNAEAPLIKYDVKSTDLGNSNAAAVLRQHFKTAAVHAEIKAQPYRYPIHRHCITVKH